MLQICLLGASLKIKDITRRARRRCGAAAEGRLRDRRCVVRLEGSGGAASRAGAFGAKGVGIEIVRLAVLLGICGCHAGSAVGFCNDRSSPAVRISPISCKCSRLELCVFGVASLTSVELLCCDVWLYFNFSNLFSQGQCCVSQMQGWHLQNQSPWPTAIQLLKGAVRCH